MYDLRAKSGRGEGGVGNPLSVLLGRTNLLRRNNSLSFKHGIELIGREVAQGFNLARWPSNLQAIDLRRRTQTEVHTKIVLREIAAAAVDLVGLCHAPGHDLQARIQCQ